MICCPLLPSLTAGPLLLVPYCMFLKIKMHANHCAVGLSITREIKPCYIHTPTHPRTHQQCLSKAAWWVSAAHRAAWNKHKQTLSFPHLFFFFFFSIFPSSALSAALLLLYLETVQEQTWWKLHCASCLLVFCAVVWCCCWWWSEWWKKHPNLPIF